MSVGTLETTHMLFTVAAVSTNHNSFGYKSVIAIDLETGVVLKGLKQAFGSDRVPCVFDTIAPRDLFLAETAGIAPAKVLKALRDARDAAKGAPKGTNIVTT